MPPKERKLEIERAVECEEDILLVDKYIRVPEPRPLEQLCPR